MLKYILCFSVCLFALAMPSFADLTQRDLNEIRKVIKEEIEKEIMPIKTEIASVKREVARVRGKLDRFGKDIIWSIAIIAVAGIIPQSIIAWRKRKVRFQEKQIQEKKIRAALIAEAEKLKQQRIMTAPKAKALGFFSSFSVLNFGRWASFAYCDMLLGFYRSVRLAFSALIENSPSDLINLSNVEVAPARGAATGFLLSPN